LAGLAVENERQVDGSIRAQATLELANGRLVAFVGAVKDIASLLEEQNGIRMRPLDALTAQAEALDRLALNVGALGEQLRPATESTKQGE
jgi:hypothetical protein